MMQGIDVRFRKFLAGQCATEEAEQLLDYFSSPEGDPELVRLIAQELDSLDAQGRDNTVPFAMEDNLRMLRDRIKPTKRKPKIYRLWPYAAAAMVVALAVGVWGWPGLNGEGNPPESQQVTIAPGGNRATLTLGDGQTVPLSEAQKGINIGDAIVYTDGTAVLGVESVLRKDREINWLQLATPRGGTYQVTLPDGTRVWLNAASTLKYPTQFDAEERVVELDGEAYFEVTKDIHKPFRVITDRQQVAVLGTTFNITSYGDEEEVRTTLVEGAVQVTLNQLGNPMSVLLSPSEQARLVRGRLTKQVVDVETEVAWHKGLFAFRSKKLEDIMRQIARWYDVEVEIKDSIASRTFSGTISRYADINELLETLALTDKVRFELRGNTIVVQPR